jgi:hypothetical protein
LGGDDVQNDSYSFVVRIWQETVDSDGTAVAWRGSIDDVGDGERAYFADLDGILPFIRKQIGWAFDAALSRREDPIGQGGA